MCICIKRSSSSNPCNLFSSYLSIQLFCYVLSISIFYSKIILLPMQLVVRWSSCIVDLLVGFSFVILECPVLFALFNLVLITFKSSVFCRYRWLISSSILRLVCHFILFFSSQHKPFSFFSFSTFDCYRNFFTCSSCLIFPFRFCISDRFPKGNMDFIKDKFHSSINYLV